MAVVNNISSLSLIPRPHHLKKFPRNSLKTQWQRVICAITWGMTKSKTFRSWQPGQNHLLSPSPIELLPSDHLVFFLLDLPHELDYSAIMAPALAKDQRGENGFAPWMMMMVVVMLFL